MGVTKSFVLLLLVSFATDVWPHRRHRHEHSAEYRKENSRADLIEQEQTNLSEKTADSTQSELLKKNKKHLETLNSKSIPFSARRLEKMLEKAILKIITGDLGTAEMLLLKSLNYTPEQVLAIREQELNKHKEEESRKVAESNAKKVYSENLYGNKAKHWNYNSMEFNSSPRNDPDVDVSRNERKRNRHEKKAPYDFDFDAYNRQAIIDYENMAAKLELQQSSSEPATLDYEDELRNSEETQTIIHRSFDRAMEPHVIFKIPYDDSEFDSSSGSDEKSKFAGRDALAPSKGSKHRAFSTLKHTTAKNVANSFHASSLSPSSSFFSVNASDASSAASAATGHTPLPVAYQLRNFKSLRPDYLKNQAFLSTTESPEPIITIITNVTSNTTRITFDTITDFNNSTNNDSFFKDMLEDADNTTVKKINGYEGLEWIGEDVYRVIPGYSDSPNYDNFDESEPSDYEEQNLDSHPDGSGNDTLEYQNDAPETRLFMVNASVENASLPNPSTYQPFAQNRDEGVTSGFNSEIKQMIEDIKKKILMLTNRYNDSISSNQVQHEKLDMFPPTCQMPRNTDSEAWTDQFSMNMHFQLNLTSDNHVTVARLRLYKLPQENLTTSVSEGDEDEDSEKKIRISVYYYTKSLKKHRSKKRLMDSVVTPLTTNGTYLALEVKQGLRFWRLTPQNPHSNGNNYGLVVQIEDQDGQPLKPASYIQQPSCGEDHNSDSKASQQTPALFIRACTRYSRVVGGKEVTYVNCRH